MKRTIRLADPRRATPGNCCICGGVATKWLRGTTSWGYVLAVRACDEHEPEAIDLRQSLSPEDIAGTIPRRKRAVRGAQCCRQADRLEQRSNQAYRLSADLQGASSVTHFAALIGGYEEQRARGYRRLAAVLAGMER